MTFAFDSGDKFPELQRVAGAVEEGHSVKFVSLAKARAAFNKIKSNIEAHEDAAELDRYMRDESLILDALFLYDSFVAQELQDIYEAQRSYLIHGGAA